MKLHSIDYVYSMNLENARCRSGTFASNLLTFLLQLLVGGSYDAATKVGDDWNDNHDHEIVEKDDAHYLCQILLGNK